MKNLSMILTILLLTACGGGSNSDNNSGAVTQLSGKAIDGYLIGATVFLDLNFNNQLDTGEPKTVTEGLGDFVLDVPGRYQKCQQYVPVVVDVPVGAIDTDRPDTPIEEAYSMVFPPTFSLTTKQDLINLTPLTTVVWKEVEKELLAEQGGVLSCESILSQQALMDSISRRLEEQELRVARRYNVTVDQLYGDYIADSNKPLHELAQKLVLGLQKSYTETQLLEQQYPSAIAYVEYFWGIWDHQSSAYDKNWYREEFVQPSTGNLSSETHLMSEYLEERVSLHHKWTMETVQRNGVNVEVTKDIQFFNGIYHCSINEWLETIEAFSSGVRNTIYGQVNSWGECDARYIFDQVSQSLETKRYDLNNKWLLGGSSHYYGTADSGFRHLIGVTDSITAMDLKAIGDYIDGDFYSEASHGAQNWSRSKNEFSDDQSQPAQVMTFHTQDGIWSRSTIFRDGTSVKECGNSEDDMYFVDANTQCE